MQFIKVEPGEAVSLAVQGDIPDQAHIFEAEAIAAVNAAMAAGRPLLVRGEPGVGKSQLARAAAKVLGRAFVHEVVDGRTEARDLLWHFDAVERLAEAQIANALGINEKEALRDALNVINFVRPGPLWWAFDWSDAAKQADKVKAAHPKQRDSGDDAKGTVVLIDEIDKAESDVPNGLLEALGAGEFLPYGRAEPVKAKSMPLVVVTTNEERALPDAFVRRCLVLPLSLPSSGHALVEWLVKRGEAHFPELANAVHVAAAEQLDQDRKQAIDERRLPLPGQAEYLDLLRAVTKLSKDLDVEPMDVLKQIGRFLFSKTVGLS